MSLKIGVAFYAQTDSRGRATSPHWAVVAHPKSLLAPDVQVFQIRQNGPNGWYLAPHVCSLLNAPTLIGVLAFPDIPGMSVNQLDRIVSQFPSTKNGNDPSGNIVWNCSGWVIRVLDSLIRPGYIRVGGCRVDQIYNIAGRRVQALKLVHKTPQAPLVILPFFA